MFNINYFTVYRNILKKNQHKKHRALRYLFIKKNYLIYV